jgi:predicted DCC family thiol-disulfide oxidoreductase YuxK
VNSFDVEVFFDGECPVCSREIAMLRRLDRRRRRIRFTDIAAHEFDASSIGRSHADVMDRLHGRLPDGMVIEGVEVFRRLYASLGFAPLVAASRLPGIRHALDWVYATFAKNRLRLTGRCRSDGCTLHARG